MSKPHPKRNDPCPCGSELKYKHCCESKKQLLPGKYRGVPYWMLGLIGFAVLAGGLWVVSQMTGASGRPSVASGAGAASTTQGPPGQPWEFDETNNRHFDPGHGHWHDGPPPINPTATSPTTLPTVTPSSAANNSPFGTRPGGRPIASQTPQDDAASTPIDPTKPRPEPWAYDAAVDKHFDPTHSHWHNGPAPWQFDPQTNRHWDPGHNHWHNGPVPADASRADGSTIPQPQGQRTGHEGHNHP